MTKKNKRMYSSFRDSSCYLFYNDKGDLCRKINHEYKEHYNMFLKSGLFELLKKEKKVVDFEEVEEGVTKNSNFCLIIKPQKIPFISYPYEWCFSELKDAALLTLKIQKEALKKGMTLKDASAFNVQFFEGRPIHIDTLSFEKYNKGEPWIAYRQFCQHFLAPLALIAYRDLRLNQMSKNFIDGIPLDLSSTLLPFKTKLHFSLLAHIHFHAKVQKRYSDDCVTVRKKISENGIFALIENLENCIKKISYKKTDTEWSGYYLRTNYASKSFDDKKEIVKEMIKEVNPKNLWDLGANNGLFSRVAGDLNIPTISFDVDLNAVEENYCIVKKKKEKYILPLFLDLTNPSPSIGWSNKERESLTLRGPVDIVLALALIHHLTISNNTPFSYVAEYFHKLCEYLIIEFVPRNDSMVVKLLESRKHKFDEYKQEKFEFEFSVFFYIQKKVFLKSSKRIIYLMKKK